MGKLKIPDCLKEKNGNVHWNKHSLGFSPVEKVALLFEINNLTGVIKEVGVCDSLSRQTQITYLCLEHEKPHENKSLILNLLKGHYCSKCGRDKATKNRVISDRRIKINTLKDATEFIENVNPDCFDVLGFDRNKQRNLLLILRCKVCGTISNRAIASCDKRCRVCYTNARRISKELFLERANTLHNNVYKYDLEGIEEFTTKSIIRVFCSIHGMFKQKVDSHLNGDRCKKCADIIVHTKIRMQYDEILEKCNNVHNGRYTYPLINEEYVNNKTKVSIKCSTHGIFKQTINAHLGGDGCPTCNNSRLECEIQQYLENNNIFYLPQHKFSNCTFKRELKFDFWIPSLAMVIEANGEQHYKRIPFFHRDNHAFEQQIIRDEIKRTFCTEHGITFLEVHDKNINQLDELINSQSL